MLPTHAKSLRAKRDEKAKMIRGLRNETSLGSDAIKRLAAMSMSETPRPEPEILADYFPIYRRKHDRGVILSAVSGDWESYTKRWLLPGDWDDEDIADCLGVFEHYGGPGRGFTRSPWVERNGHSTLVTQQGGMDI